jgi:hypothetical protein
MHTFEGKSCRIHHYSDMSGEVHICDKNSDKDEIFLTVRRLWNRLRK